LRFWDRRKARIRFWKEIKNIAPVRPRVRLIAACVNDGDSVRHIIVKNVHVMRLSCSSGTGRPPQQIAKGYSFVSVII
jgi:hypothetical protein